MCRLGYQHDQLVSHFICIVRSLSTCPFWPTKKSSSGKFKWKGPRRARTFSRHNSPNSRALADWSERTERLWSMSRAILARTNLESSCVPFKNWLVGPARSDEWKETLLYMYSVCFFAYVTKLSYTRRWHCVEDACVSVLTFKPNH